jgi:PAS domain S-box-containing protein
MESSARPSVLSPGQGVGVHTGLEPVLAAEESDIDGGQRQARLQLHANATVNSAMVSATVAAALVLLLWHRLPTPAVVAWVLALAGALGWRLWLGRQLRRQLAAGDGLVDALAGDVWRSVYASFLLHGLVWAVVGPGLVAVAPPTEVQLVVFAIVCLAGGAFLVTAFDLRAALWFGLPALLPTLLATAWWHPTKRPMLFLVALFVVSVFLAARRVAHALSEIVQLRAREAQRAREARHLAQAAEVARAHAAEQHLLLTRLLATTSQGCWFIDNAGCTTDVNLALCALLGRTREELLGRPVLDFFAEKDQASLKAQARTLDQGQTATSELLVERPDGVRRHVRCDATPLLNNAGQRIGAVALFSDLTAYVQTEQRLRTYEVVTNAITDLVSVIDETRVYRLVNDAWCRSTGHRRENAEGHSVQALMSHLVNTEHHDLLGEAVLGQVERVVVVRLTLPGQGERVMETHYFPYGLDAEGRRCVVAVTRDVSERESARAALALSEEYLRRTLNATGDAIVASDADSPDQPVRFANAQMLKLWGMPETLADKLTPNDFMRHAEPLFIDRDAEVRRIEAIVRHNLADESQLQLRDGRVLLRRCIPADLQGRTLRVWSFRDITSEVRAMEEVQDSEAEQRALLEAFPGYIARIDADMHYRFANHRMAALLGSTPQQIVGRTVGDVVGQAREVLVRDAVRRALQGERVLLDRHHPAQNGRPERFLQVTMAAGVDPRSGQRSVYAFGVDVSELQQAQTALTAARDEAERANQAKSRFLSQMSHELRTPLNAILGFAQLLDRQSRPPLPPAQRAQVQEILRGARHLLGLINEILDLGRIESGALTLDMQAVPLAALLDDCLGLVRPLAQNHQVLLRPPPPGLDALAVRADPLRLKQVLLNLLGNAIKFNHRGGEVALLCQVQGGELVLTVRDTGPGLLPEEMARLFQPFERLDAERRGVEGTGIGLALSHRLLQAMGGDIGVHSQVGEGAAFWLRLPACPLPAPQLRWLPDAAGEPLGAGQPDAQADRLAERAALGPPRRVLYVEDNPINAMLMQAMLEPLPQLQVRLAPDGPSGLRLATESPPDLVLMDIQMPGMDGFEVLRQLRAHPATATVPVIAVSAAARQADIDTALAAGFSAYLAKPVDMGSLHLAVLSALRLA